MKFDCESQKLYISVDELSTYAFRRENEAKLMKKYGFIKKIVSDTNICQINKKTSQYENKETILNIPKSDTVIFSFNQHTDTIQTEVPLEKEIMYGEYSLCVQGYADIISFDGVLHTVEEIKTLSYFPRELTPFSDPSHFAHASICAYMLAESIGAPELKIKLTYIMRASGDKVSFTAKFTKIALARMFDALIARAYVFINTFAENHSIFLDECKNLPFPYKSIRAGQAEFIKKAYRTIKSGKSMIVSAPTGIGKTISSLFPSLKSLGNCLSDKIFYLTGKTVTGRSALEAAEHISKYVPHLHAIMICSKEQICPCKKQFPEINFRTACRFCDKSGTSEKFKDFKKERQFAAMSELFKSEKRIYTVERIVSLADKYNVCPYELSLEISEYCAVIVCDYNYVIDDKVRFKRYFKKANQTDKFIFLFDEAHNLPDRTRDTYSASISSNTVNDIFAAHSDSIKNFHELYSVISEYRESFNEILTMCTESESVKDTENGEIITGYYKSSVIPPKLIRSAGNLYETIAKLMRDSNETYDFLNPLYAEISQLLFSSGFFDEKFRFFAYRENNLVSIKILCIDPSDIIKRMISHARATIMFSATMAPIEYYKEVTGCQESDLLELQSPFENNNLCLVAYDSLSTRFSDRNNTIFDCANVIAETVSVNEGKYIVYFSSYDYMKRVCRAFMKISYDCDIVMQRPSMSYGEKERFINLFRDSTKKFVVGFCVLGGVFSEGIDLTGESLIGTIIIGIGMPQLSAERNIMAEYYDEKNDRGHDFAYACPGMNKVLQAAGRVIRSENDRGIVVLVDDRFGTPNIKMMFPPHWRHMKYTGDTESLKIILKDFWDRT